MFIVLPLSRSRNHLFWKRFCRSWKRDIENNAAFDPTFVNSCLFKRYTYVMRKSNILNNRKYKKVGLYVRLYGKIWLFLTFSYIFSYWYIFIYLLCIYLFIYFCESKKNRIRRNVFSENSSTRMGARGGAVSWGTSPQARRSRVRFRMWSTKPLTKMSTRRISWEVKAAGAFYWQPCHLHVPTIQKF